MKKKQIIPRAKAETKPDTPATLTPKEKAQVDRDIFRNILAKIKGGGVPTLIEQRILDAATLGGAEAKPEPHSRKRTESQIARDNRFMNFYELSQRRLQEWKKAYLDKTGQPCPLEDPEKMRDLWPSVFKGPVSPNILRAIEKHLWQVPVMPGIVARIDPVKGVVPLIEGDFNYNDSVALAELNLRACAQILDTALASGDAGAIRNAQPAYLAAAETYRKSQISAARVNAQQGNSFDADKIREELHAIHVAIPREIRSTVKDKLVEFYTLEVNPTPQQIRVAVDDAVDLACIRLKDTAFA